MIIRPVVSGRVATWPRESLTVGSGPVLCTTYTAVRTSDIALRSPSWLPFKSPSRTHALRTRAARRRRPLPRRSPRTHAASASTVTVREAARQTLHPSSSARDASGTSNACPPAHSAADSTQRAAAWRRDPGRRATGRGVPRDVACDWRCSE